METGQTPGEAWQSVVKPGGARATGCRMDGIAAAGDDCRARLHETQDSEVSAVLAGMRFGANAQSSSTMVMAFQLFIGMSSRLRFES